MKFKKKKLRAPRRVEKSPPKWCMEVIAVRGTSNVQDVLPDCPFYACFLWFREVHGHEMDRRLGVFYAFGLLGRLFGCKVC